MLIDHEAAIRRAALCHPHLTFTEKSHVSLMGSNYIVVYAAPEMVGPSVVLSREEILYQNA